MLFDDKILFIHVPKTAGVSVTKFLIDNLPGPVTLAEGPDHADPAAALPVQVRAKLGVKRLLRRMRVGVPAKVRLIDGKRHERLNGARTKLAAIGRRLEDFRAILAVIRNPYDLEVSRYHYLRRGYHGVKGAAEALEQKIALEGDFEQFAINAPYHGQLPANIERWYEIARRMPPNLRILRFENLETDLNRAVAEIYPVTVPLPRLNATQHDPYASYLTPKAEAAIYIKYLWLFERQFYAREKL